MSKVTSILNYQRLPNLPNRMNPKLRLSCRGNKLISARTRSPHTTIRAVLFSVAAMLGSAWVDAHGEDYLIGSSPSLTREQGERIFQPIAELLGKATGVNFEYSYTAHWPGYIEDMRNSKHSLLFDEPHLVSWRLEYGTHSPVVKLSGDMGFVITARRNDESIVQLSDLAGRIVCAGAPPALDGLILYEQFANPSRQPQILPTANFRDAYDQLLNERCRAAVLPTTLYEALSLGSGELRVLFLSEAFPNWTLTADNRIPQPVLNEIRAALLDSDNQNITGVIASEIDPGKQVLRASVDEYPGYSRLLQDFWGLR
jgi:ABC-type phosphate/phosphonate transport system substrate-binding protein